jgi:hypothetical protein
MRSSVVPGWTSWLASRVSLRASTSRGYAAHIRAYLVQYLGSILIGELSADDVQAMFTAIIRRTGSRVIRSAAAQVPTGAWAPACRRSTAVLRSM